MWRTRPRGRAHACRSRLPYIRLEIVQPRRAAGRLASLKRPSRTAKRLAAAGAPVEPLVRRRFRFAEQMRHQIDALQFLPGQARAGHCPLAPRRRWLLEPLLRSDRRCRSRSVCPSRVSIP